MSEVRANKKIFNKAIPLAVKRYTDGHPETTERIRKACELVFAHFFNYHAEDLKEKDAEIKRLRAVVGAAKILATQIDLEENWQDRNKVRKAQKTIADLSGGKNEG